MTENAEQIALNALLEAVIIVDSQGKIQEANKRALWLLGYPDRERVIMQPIGKICPEADIQELRSSVPAAEKEMIWLRQDGKQVIVSANIICRMKYSDDMMLMARDISRSKALVAELTDSQAELRESYREMQDSKQALILSEKLAFTGRVAAGIAHEVRNPLTNVIMSLQQIKKAIKGRELKERHFEIVERNIERINFLITELLNCARPPKLDVSPYDLHQIIDNVLELNKAKLEKAKVKVVKRFSADALPMCIDRIQMEQAFANMIVNAIEAMPENGGLLTISSEINKGNFVVKIEDNGRGIQEEDMIKIFDPFFSRKSQGIGLGLTVCNNIIGSHGGSIEVESDLDRGSVFTVSLPLKSQRKPESKE